MMMSRAVPGRPPIWPQKIGEYVETHGAMSVREIRAQFGLSKSTAYHVVSSLVDAGGFCWTLDNPRKLVRQPSYLLERYFLALSRVN